jgi:hypothetical protein
MVSPILEEELHRQLEHLSFGKQHQVLNFARALASSRIQGVAGQTLLTFAGTIAQDDIEAMSQAVAEDCEKIDTHEW